MEKFKSIYPFTTENIAGYMHNLDLTDKRIITVSASGDHALNAILKGCKDITCFDVNNQTKYYMQDKIQAILDLSYEDFIRYVLMDNKFKDKYDLEFKYFNPESKKKCNMYLSKENYQRLKELIKDVSIRYIDSNITDLKIDEHYDYMFLSNIADYLSYIYKDNILERYYELLMNYLEYIDYIYMAYLYDINSQDKRSRIDDEDEVKKVFKYYERKEFKTALEVKRGAIDAVLILKGRDYYGK